MWFGEMRAIERVVVVSAPLQRDEEQWRWYSEAAESCFVLTRRGRLLEPHPAFGPTSYRVLAWRIGVREARAYASSHGFFHERRLPR
jgi:hypothetical protein